MTDLDRLADTAVAEALTFADILDTLDAESRHQPTPCEGWTVDDLAAHIATGAFRDAEAFHRARLGTLSPPGTITLDGNDYSAALRLAMDHLRDALARAPHRWPIIPTPFGGYPVATALHSLIVEFGVHRNDLEVAAGSPDAPLSEATRQSLFGFGSDYLLLQSAPLDTAAVTFSLIAPTAAMSITWTDDRWVSGNGSDRECRISGSDDDIARLMLRRLNIDDTRLDVHDPHHLATLFPEAVRPL